MITTTPGSDVDCGNDVVHQWHTWVGGLA